MSSPWAVSPRLRTRQASTSSSSSSAPTVRAQLSPAPLAGSASSAQPPSRPDSPDWGNAWPVSGVVPSHITSSTDAASPTGSARVGLIPDDSYGARLNEVLSEGSDEGAGEVHEALDEGLDLGGDEDGVGARQEDEFGEFEGGGDDPSAGTPSTPSVRSLPRRQDNVGLVQPSPRRTPFLPPNVSRLRSHTRYPSTSSINTTHSATSNGGTPTANPFLSPTAKRLRPKSVHSHLSALSRSSSANMLAIDRLKQDDHELDGSDGRSSLAPGSVAGIDPDPPLGPGFVFHTLRRASAMLSTQDESGRPRGIGGLGEATVMAVNGMIALGTTGGYAVVLGFDQNLRCVCGSEAVVKDAGAVTALAISPDQTYITVGHAGGTIYLYDLAQPLKPVRTAPALPPHAVRSGRKEGHIAGSRVLHVDFVGKRHTALVSGDEYGRAFWWSLGKVVGVESNDVVRLLGSYEPIPGKGIGAPGEKPRRNPPTLIAATPLPLGTVPHGTDTFTLTALMTQSKLVIVGLKPSPRTWFRKTRPADELYPERLGGAVWLASGGTSRNALKGTTAAQGQDDPLLAYSWGRTIRLLRVQVVPLDTPVDPASKNPQPNRVEFIEGRTWTSDDRISWFDWFGADGRHLLVVAGDKLQLLQLSTMSVVDETLLDTHGPAYANGDSKGAFLGRHGLYKGKTFRLVRQAALACLTEDDTDLPQQHQEITLGTLLLWSDRILGLCQGGDFLSAIRLAVRYYNDEAPGNNIGLPAQPQARRALLSERILDLVRSSTNYAFSEERATDGTYDTPDKRGVDLTSLFEGLASTCLYALRSIERSDVVYDEVYERFLDNGIDGIFLDSLQDTLMVDRVSGIPPHVVKAVIARREAQGDLEAVERIIWHVEPASLDIDQVVRFCQQHGLWDALIYVFNRCLKDFVTPLIKFGELVGTMLDEEASNTSRSEETANVAYKVFGYLEHLLTGRTYPDEQPLDPEDKDRAAGDLYAAFLSGERAFKSHLGNDLQVSHHPLLQLLLVLDAEAFLHVLDLAFEDPFLNNPVKGRLCSRQIIVNVLIDIAQGSFLHSLDRTFVHIFVARNLPKYPQFLSLAPATLHRLLLDLTEHGDPSTREDRQLAVESLLSTYTPSDMGQLYVLFRRAGFFDLLRSAYRAEQRWADYVQCLIDDPGTGTEIFVDISDVMGRAWTDHNNRTALESTIGQSLPALLSLSVPGTASLLQRFDRDLHERALDELHDSPHRGLAYLRSLLDDEGSDIRPEDVQVALRQRYLDDLIETEPSSVLGYLQRRGAGFFDLQQVQQACASSKFPAGQIWALDKQNRLEEAFQVVQRSFEDITLRMLKVPNQKEQALQSLNDLVRQAVTICQDREASPEGVADLSLDDMWFRLLRDSLASLQAVATSLPENEDHTIDPRRALQTMLQDTLGCMMNATSQRGHAFPRLFKRLVEDSIHEAGPQSRRVYSQFRLVLTGMLGSYASEEEILAVTNRLVSADLFDCIERYHKARQAGWRPALGRCYDCGGELRIDERSSGTEGMQIDLYGSGEGKHVDCAAVSIVAV